MSGDSAQQQPTGGGSEGKGPGKGGANGKGGKGKGGKGKVTGATVAAIVVAVVLRVFLWGPIADALGIGNRIECSAAGTSATCVVHTRSGATHWRACWVAQLSCNNGKTLRHKNCTVLGPSSQRPILYTAQALTTAGCDSVKTIRSSEVKFSSIAL